MSDNILLKISKAAADLSANSERVFKEEHGLDISVVLDPLNDSIHMKGGIKDYEAFLLAVNLTPGAVEFDKDTFRAIFKLSHIP